MRKIIFRGLLLIFIILILNFGARHVLVDNYYWGNEKGSVKLKYLKENGRSFNTVFIGSSTTARNINPEVFDEYTETNLNIRSFNLGTQGTAPPESYVLLENLLNDEDIKLKYVILELSTIDHLRNENLESVRKKYFYTVNAYSFSINALLNSNHPREDVRSSMKNHTVVFMKNMFNFGLLMQYYSHEQDENSMSAWEKRGVIGEKMDGFVTSIQRPQRDTMSYRRFNFLTFRAFKNPDLYKYNKIHLDKIQNLINLAKEKGVHLIMLLQPKFGDWFYNETIPVYYHIDKRHKIQMADPNEYPEFYYAKYSRDKNHLNADGSKIFSRKLAEKFNTVLDESKDVGL